jgi:hypothetical protein
MDDDESQQASASFSKQNPTSNTQQTANSSSNNLEPVGNTGNPSIDTPSKCLRIINRFREGLLTKAEAIHWLELALPRGADHSTYREFALSSYTNMLSNFEQLQGRGQQQKEPAGAADHATSYADLDEVTPIPEIDGPSTTPAATASHKRKRATDFLDEEEEDGSPTDKRKFNASALPWAIRDEISPVELSQNLRRTNAILDNISRDPKSARRSLFNSASRPQFPENEWLNVLAGHAVDMDHIFSSLYAVVHDDRRIERIGDIKISVGHSTPAKTIRTHGDWVIAWDRVVEATTFAFPHRERELRTYGKYITQLFSAVPPASHSRVIQFDKACRVRVGQCQDRELSDTFAFNDIYLVWIQNGPTSLSSNTTRANYSPQSKKKEACKRWNDNRCPNTASTCTYSHTCAKCRSPTHQSPDCSQTEKK